jgi:hypothetical protein
MSATCIKSRRSSILLDDPKLSETSKLRPTSVRTSAGSRSDTTNSSSFKETKPRGSSVTAKPARYDSLVEIHAALEVYEHRIQWGQDRKHRHPALALDAFRENQHPTTRNREERHLQLHYQTMFENSRIPIFWERRVYDRPGTLMGAAETAALSSLMHKTITKIAGRKTKAADQEEAPKEAQKEQMRHKRLRMTSKRCDTDDSEGTDWEDF